MPGQLAGAHLRRWAPLTAALVVAGALLAEAVFRWDLHERYGEFGSAVLLFALFVAFVGVLAWTVLRCAGRIGKDPVGALAPPVVLCAAFALFASGALHEAVMRREFHRGFEGRERVRAMVEAGQLPVRRADHALPVAEAQLPPGDRGLSWERGRIWVYERDGARHVVFPTSLGAFQEFTGYVHRSDRGEPGPPQGYLHGPAFRRVAALGAGWYWVVAS